MDNQIKLTSIRIDATQTKIKTLLDEINQLENEVQRLEGVLNTRLALLLHRIPAAYKRSVVPQFGTLLFSRNVSDFIARAQYLSAVQKEDASLVFQVKATQNSYNESKQTREDKKVQLEQVQQQLKVQSQQLAQQKQAKDALLTQTRGQEETYAQLRREALARLAGFASFADSQGATLLSNQTSCNDWGCYYNQRDSQWGNALINGQGSGCNGPCSVLRVGCLVTSVAMMASHYGHRDISPQDIAFSSPANFSVGTAMLVRGTISVKNMNITRSSAGALSPDTLKDGPVIVGVYSGPFGTHFVVVKSYSDGTYIMNDPYIENGSDKSFTDHYSLGSVFEVDRVSM
ncbi:MAG: C39 family peptidase [Candidatus Gottesmanbacteria bacterium]|nr:C39 family peptidase [Candidatus Gottesmanbacteria bacterium]